MPSPRPAGIRATEGIQPKLRFIFPDYRDLRGRSVDEETVRDRRRALRLLRSKNIRTSYEAQIVAAKARTLFPLLLRRLRPAMRREVESHMAPSPWTRCPKCGGAIREGRCISNRYIQERMPAFGTRWVRCRAAWAIS